MRILFSAGLLATAIAAPVAAADPVAGRYLTEDGKAVVTIAPCGRALCGRVTRILAPTEGGVTTDVRNPDKALRGRPLLGLPVLTGFTDGGDAWKGRIYDPKQGKTYRSELRRGENGVLKVKGCVAIFCKTQTWRPA